MRAYLIILMAALCVGHSALAKLEECEPRLAPTMRWSHSDPRVKKVIRSLRAYYNYPFPSGRLKTLLEADLAPVLLATLDENDGGMGTNWQLRRDYFETKLDNRAITVVATVQSGVPDNFDRSEISKVIAIYIFDNRNRMLRGPGAVSLTKAIYPRPTVCPRHLTSQGWIDELAPHERSWLVETAPGPQFKTIWTMGRNRWLRKGRDDREVLTPCQCKRRPAITGKHWRSRGAAVPLMVQNAEKCAHWRFASLSPHAPVAWGDSTNDRRIPQASGHIGQNC